MSQPKRKNSSDPLICLCNAVPRSEIEAAIARGCTSLGRIFDATRAGCGPCGGTCQPKIREMLAGATRKNRE